VAHPVHVSTLSGRVLPYPAGYGRPSPGGGAFSPCLTAAGLRFLDHPYPAEGLASPCGSVTGDALQTSSGFPRSALASYDRGGRPLYSGAVVSLYGTCLRAAPSRQGMSAPRAYGPTRRLRYPSFRRSKDHGASSRIHSRSPIRSFPHPVHPMGGLLLRLFPHASHPAVTRDAREGWEQAFGHSPNSLSGK